MKKVTMVICLLIAANTTLAQVVHHAIAAKSDCASVTQRFIAQSYSLERQLALESSPEELACLDYKCAYSYELAPGQNPLRSQIELLNVEVYKSLRRIDQRVTVYDDYSGLNVVLYSWNEMEQSMIKIRSAYQLSCQK